MSSTLVLIDAAIDQVALLASSVSRDATIVVLDSQQDGVAQISAVLAAQASIEAVHLFSHGAPGTLQLGATTLNLDSLAAYDLAPWQQALRHANLLIYGCRVASGAVGDRFLQELHQRTRANIAATATTTGSAAQGGDWNLEWRIGAIEPVPILHPDVMAQYDSTLQIRSNLLYGVSEGELYEITLATGNVRVVSDLSFQTFAIARDSRTGNLYYIENGVGTGSGTPIAFFNPTTEENTVTPNTTGVSEQFVKLAQQAGSGTLFAMTSSTANLYQITLNGDIPSGAVDLGQVRLADGSILPFGGGDVAFDPDNANRLFAIVTRPDDLENRYELYTIDVTTLTATLVGNVRDQNGTTLSDVGSGSLAFGQDGDLYLTSQSDANGNASSSNRLFRVNQNTGVVISSTPIQANIQFNDFATLPITLDPEIEDPDDPDAEGCVPGINRRGNNRNNRLLGDNNINRLFGRDGNDLLRGFDCPDLLSGGRGRDLIRGGNAGDQLQGNQDNDRLNGGRGNDRLNGGLGNDTMLGGRGTDSLRGGNGNDRMFGGTGNDRMLGNQGDDFMEGGAEDDVLIGRLNRDTLRGQGGNDRLRGNLGDDRLSGGAGDDLLDGGRGEDIMEGGSGDDQLFGRLNNDVMSGGDGNDFLNGQANSDEVRGGAGRDRLIGRGGADLLVGGAQADVLNGGQGFDRMFGGAGNDRIIGGRRADRISTGRGSDIVEYRAIGDGGDRIFDFSTAVDQIDLSRIFAGSGYGSNRPFRQYVSIEQTGLDTTISIDTNGDQRGGFESFITLSGIRANTVVRRNFVV
ncbi:DUF4347 domain-containing protein [Microcoleus sp. FACHB-1515]|uniref:DUF4347 domain-containing protein n=1 Tax=Cyanophyceae TaxID=3028117 RepID=UPI001688183F|nr:DUF4347 domain-containing protein [Microcoleus sp. FACHB-1515]MBD2091098.1 DUF4347 domain-containing protein [Microcoleus sp. FACHB-1515]